MRIVTISDTHGLHDLVQVPDGDLLIFAGDCSSSGYEHEVVMFLRWFAKHPHKHKVMIAGNHDLLFENRPEFAESLIPEGVHYLNDSGCVIEGIHIWGSPFSPRFLDWAFNCDRGEQIAQHWAKIPADTDVLVTHGPLAGILDQTLYGENTGCEDLLQHIQRVKPKLHIFGHIHEGYGMLERNGTRFVNASNVDEYYRICNFPIVLEL